MRKSSLGEFEQTLLLAILRLGHRAFGTPIAEEFEDRAGRAVSPGALYSSLDRLEKKGYWRAATGVAVRGLVRRLLTAYVPARRASSVDPLESMRSE
jgi:ABC-type lipoprotein release transport system permease subunit